MGIALKRLLIERDRQTVEEAHRRTEAQLRQIQKMEAVGQLAGGVAHDFNNMLFVINGQAQMALSRIAPDDPVRATLQMIIKTGQRAAKLTSQLLAFSRRQVLQPKVVDLNAIVADMDRMLRRLIREDIVLTTRLDPELKPTRADPGQVEQVLMNLVVNARDAMSAGGRLTIETANKTLDEAYCRTHEGVEPGRYVMLAVSDTGCGLSEEVKAHLFEPFFTTKERGKGTGLGLATVYGIIKQTGGHVAVYSEPGHGTSFKVYLPRVEAVVTPCPGKVSSVLRGCNETVLLVEDDPDVRALAADILKSNGYEVVLASNGVEALRVCEKHGGKIDLVVTDVIMPNMNGPELAQHARRMYPEVQVVFMSGYADHAISAKGVLDDNAVFLQKPFTPSVLTHKLREVLDRTSRKRLAAVHDTTFTLTANRNEYGATHAQF